MGEPATKHFPVSPVTADELFFQLAAVYREHKPQIRAHRRAEILRVLRQIEPNYPE